MEAAMDRPSWTPESIDTEQPSGARVYDHFLGGAHNFAADRALADAISAMTPNIGDTMRANRAFLRRAVRYLVGEGITQFLDIGSGIPTVGNVHEVAQQIDPSARVVYVDVDPVAVAHSRAILDGRAGTAVLDADVRDVDRILAAPETQLLDRDQPIAVLLLGVLHFLPDSDDPPSIVSRLMSAVPSGSALALVNVTHEDQPPEVIEAQRLSGRTSTPIHLRSRAELAAQFIGLPLVDPGLVHLPLWRPDSPQDLNGPPERFGALAGVARTP
jgi:hypothetical protein